MVRSSSLLATFASVLLLAACAHVREPSAPTAAAGPSVAETTAELRRLGVSVRELAPDVFVAVVDSPNQSAANVLFVKARDGSVVICSSPYDTETTRALVRYVRASLHPTRILAINTHFHGDGTGGNEGYAAEGVETYASDHTIALQTARGMAGIEGMARYVESDNPVLAARVRATRRPRPTRLPRGRRADLRSWRREGTCPLRRRRAFGRQPDRALRRPRRPLRRLHGPLAPGAREHGGRGPRALGSVGRGCARARTAPRDSGARGAWRAGVAHGDRGGGPSALKAPRSATASSRPAATRPAVAIELQAKTSDRIRGPRGNELAAWSER